MIITFTVLREAGLWVAVAPDHIGGGFTATSLAALKRDIESVVPHMYPDQPGLEITIEYAYQLPGAASEYLALRAERDRIERACAAKQAEAIQELTHAGISQRDAAVVLSLSKQRIHQLQSAAH